MYIRKAPELYELAHELINDESNIRALPEPIPCRGALSLWDVPADIVAQINAGKEAVAA